MAFIDYGSKFHTNMYGKESTFDDILDNNPEDEEPIEEESVIDEIEDTVPLTGYELAIQRHNESLERLNEEQSSESFIGGVSAALIGVWIVSLLRKELKTEKDKQKLINSIEPKLRKYFEKLVKNMLILFAEVKKVDFNALEEECRKKINPTINIIKDYDYDNYVAKQIDADTLKKLKEKLIEDFKKTFDRWKAGKIKDKTKIYSLSNVFDFICYEIPDERNMTSQKYKQLDTLIKSKFKHISLPNFFEIFCYIGDIDYDVSGEDGEYYKGNQYTLYVQLLSYQDYDEMFSILEGSVNEFRTGLSEEDYVEMDEPLDVEDGEPLYLEDSEGDEPVQRVSINAVEIYNKRHPDNPIDMSDEAYVNTNSQEYKKKELIAGIATFLITDLYGLVLFFIFKQVIKNRNDKDSRDFIKRVVKDHITDYFDNLELFHRNLANMDIEKMDEQLRKVDPNINIRQAKEYQDIVSGKVLNLDSITVKNRILTHFKSAYDLHLNGNINDKTKYGTPVDSDKDNIRTYFKCFHITLSDPSKKNAIQRELTMIFKKKFPNIEVFLVKSKSPKVFTVILGELIILPKEYEKMFKTIEEENIKYEQRKLDEKYKRKSSESLSSGEYSTESLTAGIASTILVSVITSFASSLATFGVTLVVNEAMKRRLRTILTKYIDDVLDDMTKFGKTLDAFHKSDILKECKEIDPKGEISFFKGLEDGVERYSEQYLRKNNKKLSKYFEKLFITTYKAHKNGTDLDKENLAFSEFVINGKLGDSVKQTPLLDKIANTIKSYGNNFDTEVDWFKADHTFKIQMSMTPTINLKQMVADFDKLK